MNLRYTFLTFSVIASLMACSQSKSLVKKTDAFFFVRLPGTIPVDPEGNAQVQTADTTVLVYVETGKATIVWKEAFMNGKAYHVIAEKLPNKSIEIGFDKKTQRKLAVRPKANHQLWQLTFKPKANLEAATTATYGLVIKGQAGKTKLSIPIKSKKEIILSELP